MTDASRIHLLGCPLNRLTMDQLVDCCLEWVRARTCAHQVITINAAILMMMRNDADLRSAIHGAETVVADGASVVLASRLLGSPLPERVTGVDLMERLLGNAGRHRSRVFFLGAQAHVVRRLAETAQEKYPGLIVAGCRDGYFDSSQWDSVIHEIRDSRADMLFVGMPTPFKEVWCHRNLQAFGVPLTLGVGGSFDVLAGFVRRAPQWMQKSGLEWLWRVMMEPRRLWKRYLVTNTQFIWLVLNDIVRQWGRRPAMRVDS